MIVFGVNNGITQAGKSLKDGSCVVIKDGQIEGAICEERVARIKHAGGFSAAYNHLKNCLSINPDSIDLVVTSSCCEDEKLSLKNDQLYNLFSSSKIISCNHHLSHAYSVYFTSPFDISIIIVLDAGGNTFDDCTNPEWWKCKREQNSYYLAVNGKVELIGRDFFGPEETGMGELYRAFTYFTGWNSSSFAGNTMALAGRKHSFNYDESRKNIFHHKDGHIYTSTKNSPDSPILLVENVLRTAGFSTSPSSLDKIQIAKWIQCEIERSLCKLVNRLIRETGVDKICFSGGVAYNCKSMSKITYESKASEIFVCPVAGDQGQALGNAIFGHLKICKKPMKFHYTGYYGPSYDTNFHMISKLIEKLKLPLIIQHSCNISQEAAELLANGNNIGWYQGKSEYGPRALGNRSILASPLTKDVKKKLNIIKGRGVFKILCHGS